MMLGYTCAYTPLPLLDAAGFDPYRILPSGDSPDQAGRILHDNLCPHVKRILDRALANDLPELSGMILMNSCDAMRRLADAWPQARPKDRIILLDLPSTADDEAARYFSHQLSRLADTLEAWTGAPIGPEKLRLSFDKYNEIAGYFETLRSQLLKGKFKGNAQSLHDLYNQASTASLPLTLAKLRDRVSTAEPSGSSDQGVPVLLFGNVLPDPEAFALFESCGASVIVEDMCTGSRLFQTIPLSDTEKDFHDNTGTELADLLSQMARHLLNRQPCARTMDPGKPGNLADDILAAAKACHARGVIAHTAKFCDPYLDRLPLVRDVLRESGLPLLVLEGDCTLGAMGQQRTRIEAFIEMLR